LAVLVTLTLGATIVAGAFAAAGDLDSSFSRNGKATIRVAGGSNFVGGVAIQADGKIVVAGQAGSKFALVRYRRNGTLDPTFGGDGVVTTNLTRRADGARAVAIQPNGKIVAAGFAGGRGGRFALVRYRSNGNLDRTFSLNGIKLTNFTRGPDHAFGLALQSDGKIVAAGGTRLFSGRGRFALARYKRDGTLDTNFSTDGKVTTDFTSSADRADGVAIQSDGKIVAAGAAAMFTHTGESGFALARYNSDGTLDPSFDADGKVTTHFGSIDERASGVAIQADGKIVAAGTSGQTEFDTDSKFALARYNNDGTLDTSFDGDGLVTTNFSSDFDGADGGVAIQPDGKIVAAGHRLFLSFALARYNSDGTLDTSFSGNGKVTTKFHCCSQSAEAVAIQANGKIVAAGDVGESLKFAVVRYLGG
jgi:uncharacterized delta-60 repeat protein